ncbi:hypothetical protein OG233_20310 [Streptomyces sp. NBC_01218]|uniref:hypothetical protein n=1 Tax=Streptomyces sp. NBC_01218 TaxID=2903780 RepID=UPI002E0FCE7A|nr:hypothetical protein OG233_20310 [Streptomyces sp. NBC_01218]
MLHLGTETGPWTTAATSKDAGAPPAVPPPATSAPIGGCAAHPCDLVTVPARQGLEAVDILRRGAALVAVGPVLHDGAGDTVGFLVPHGTAAGWDVPGSACTSTEGRGLRLPASLAADAGPGAGQGAGQGAGPIAADGPPLSGTDWLLPPAEDAPVTDPAALRAALDQAARMIEAADNCR